VLSYARCAITGAFVAGRPAIAVKGMITTDMVEAVKHQREASMLAHSVMLLVFPNATDILFITERHSLPLSSDTRITVGRPYGFTTPCGGDTALPHRVDAGRCTDASRLRCQPFGRGYVGKRLQDGPYLAALPSRVVLMGQHV